jgi:hypothetical protein
LQGCYKVLPVSKAHLGFNKNILLLFCCDCGIIIMLNVFPADYAIATCNMKDTPSNAGLTSRLEKFYGRSSAELQTARQSFLPLILRCWQESVHLQHRWILTSPDRPYGEVSDVFARIELQSEGGAGNLPHIHMGITSVDTGNIEDIFTRVACRDQEMEHPAKGVRGSKNFQMSTDLTDTVNSQFLFGKYWSRGRALEQGRKLLVILKLNPLKIFNFSGQG